MARVLEPTIKNLMEIRIQPIELYNKTVINNRYVFIKYKFL